MKTLAGLVRMLGMPDTKDAFDELKKVKSASVGSLLAFMQSFNLRFGPATKPREKMLYNRLYPVLDETRDRIREALGTKPDTTTTARANPSEVVERFLEVDRRATPGQERGPRTAQAESMSRRRLLHKLRHTSMLRLWRPKPTARAPKTLGTPVYGQRPLLFSGRD